MHHFASAASSHISQLQFLDIHLDCNSHLAFWSSAFPQVPNLKKLSISSLVTSNHSLLPVTRLIWASPRLEEFTLKFWIRGGEAPTAYMKEIANVGRSPHQHLKVFGLYLRNRHAWGLSDHVVELVTYVSNNCVALRRIDINGPALYDDPALQLLQSQLPNHVQLSIRRW